ncbi:cysteine-rich venom protein 2 isoform X2 [Ixodes scapularis]|uniref:cysteine-rich venom protein 2 isoform X2 n=1 Tax=Ixodes scapularis TaxID=6945 RepID=UPI001161A68A|nr:cysteine-rich venom protein 2 isoform X2 [Ixodes scapularis]
MCNLLLKSTCLGLSLLAVLCLAGRVPVLQRPKVYGDKLSKRSLDPYYRPVRKRITLYHNFFRTRVDPPASDMLEMTWHKGAAADAQRWAQACQLLIHDNATGRWVEDYGSCGQNIFVSNVKVPWFFAIKIWFLEHHNFSFGDNSNNIPSMVGHYTQRELSRAVRQTVFSRQALQQMPRSLPLEEAVHQLLRSRRLLGELPRDRQTLAKLAVRELDSGAVQSVPSHMHLPETNSMISNHQLALFYGVRTTADQRATQRAVASP